MLTANLLLDGAPVGGTGEAEPQLWAVRRRDADGGARRAQRAHRLARLRGGGGGAPPRRPRPPLHHRTQPGVLVRGGVIGGGHSEAEAVDVALAAVDDAVLVWLRFGALARGRRRRRRLRRRRLRCRR